MQIPRRPRRRNAIVLTSLVDVLFVLLFFFMLVTTYGDWRSWSMNLGGQAGAGSDAAAQSVLLLRDGGLLLGSERLPIQEIEKRLSAPQARAVVVAESGVSLQAMVDVLDRLKPTGAALSLGRQAPPPVRSAP